MKQLRLTTLPTAALTSLLRTAAMARKEFRQLVRDRLTLGMIVGIPALQLTLFGYAIEMDVRHIPTAIVDDARTALSRRIVGELRATQTFDIRMTAASESEAIDLLERGSVGAVIHIPPDFDSHLLRGKGAEISIFADASNPTVVAAVAAAGKGYASRLAAQLSLTGAPGSSGSLRLLPKEAARIGPTADRIRDRPVRVAVLPFYNPERRTAVFIVPGLLGVILTMTMMLMTALAVVRERERGTFEFLITTPARRSEVMVGKILPYLGVGLVQIVVVLGLGVLLFDVPVRGSLMELGLGGAVFVAAMLLMGLVISSLAANQFQAMQLSFFFFLPSILLSGFMFPFESMPRVARWLGELLPLTHFLRIARGILVKAAPLDHLRGELAAIALFGAIALVVAVATFRKRLE